MVESERDISDQGWQVALRRRQHPGRLREVLREEVETWTPDVLPLAVLALFALVGPSLFLFPRGRLQLALYGLYLIGTLAVLGWAILRVRRHIRMSVTNTEEYLESLFESIPDPVFVIGRGGRIIAGNRIAISTFGEVVLGRTCCQTYLRHDHGAGLPCAVREVWERRKPRFELVRDEHGVRRYEVTTFPLFGRNGFSGRLVQQIRDVSSDAAMEDRASLLDDAVNSVQDPVFTLDLRGDLQHLNRAAEAVFGSEPRDGPPRPATEVLPFLREVDRETFLQAVRDFKTWESEVELQAGMGDTMRATLSLAPIRAQDDRLLGTVAIVRDVTEVKRLQGQLIQNEKLSAVGELVAGIAHELNNPLTTILGFSELLKDRHGGGPLGDKLKHVHAHAQRCKSIIDGLLKFARGQSGERRPECLNEVVRGAKALLRSQLFKKGHRLVLELDDSLPASCVDALQIQQVVVNLVTNAQDAIEGRGGCGTIHIRTGRAEDEQVFLEVEDDGMGMSEEVLQRIFDPFYTTKQVGRGTGLGLSLSYGIIRDHGGRITASSRVGEGTRFRIALPIGASGAAVAVDDGTHGEETPPLEVAGLHILVVDDEPLILELLRELLEQDGHRVATELEAETALERVEGEAYDAIFSDWRMPGMAGEEFYRSLVERRPGYRGRVVFITGDTMDTDVVRLAAEDGNQLLNKPFTIDGMRRVVAGVPGPALEHAPLASPP